MPDTGVMHRIRSMLDEITAHDDLKTVATEVLRRGLGLQREAAARFQTGEKVCWSKNGRRTLGVVERSEGGKVLVRLDHGFLARVPPSELRSLGKVRNSG